MDPSSFKSRKESFQSKLGSKILIREVRELSASPPLHRKPSSIAVVKNALYWKSSEGEKHWSRSPRRVVRSSRESSNSPRKSYLSGNSILKNSNSFTREAKYRKESLPHRDAVNSGITSHRRSISPRLKIDEKRFRNKNDLPLRQTFESRRNSYEEFPVDLEIHKSKPRGTVPFQDRAKPFYPGNKFRTRSLKQINTFRNTRGNDIKRDNFSYHCSEDRGRINAGDFKKVPVEPLQISPRLVYKSVEKKQFNSKPQFATEQAGTKNSFRPEKTIFQNERSSEKEHSESPKKSSIEWKSLTVGTRYSKDVDLRTVNINTDKHIAGTPSLMQLRFTKFENNKVDTFRFAPAASVSSGNQSEFSLQFMNNERLRGLSPKVNSDLNRHRGLIDSFVTNETGIRESREQSVVATQLRKSGESGSSRDMAYLTFRGSDSEEDDRKMMQSPISSSIDVDDRILYKNQLLKERKRISSDELVEDEPPKKTARLNQTSKPKQSCTRNDEESCLREVCVKANSTTTAAATSSKNPSIVPENVTIVRRRAEGCRPLHLREEFSTNSPGELDYEIVKDSKNITLMFTPNDTATVSCFVRGVIESFLEEHPVITTHKQIKHKTSLTLNERFNATQSPDVESISTTLNSKLNEVSKMNRTSNKTDAVLGSVEHRESSVKKRNDAAANSQRLVKLSPNKINREQCYSENNSELETNDDGVSNLGTSGNQKSVGQVEVISNVSDERLKRDFEQRDKRRIIRAAPLSTTEAKRTDLTSRPGDVRLVKISTQSSNKRNFDTSLQRNVEQDYAKSTNTTMGKCLPSHSLAQFKSASTVINTNFGVLGAKELIETPTLNSRFSSNKYSPPTAVRLAPKLSGVAQEVAVKDDETEGIARGRSDGQNDLTVKQVRRKRFKRPSDYLASPVANAVKRSNETVETPFVSAQINKESTSVPLKQRIGEKRVTTQPVKAAIERPPFRRISPIVPPHTASSTTTTVKQFDRSNQLIIANVRPTSSFIKPAACYAQAPAVAKDTTHLTVNSSTVADSASVAPVHKLGSAGVPKQAFDLRSKLSTSGRQKIEAMSTTQDYILKPNEEAKRPDVRRIMLSSSATDRVKQDDRPTSAVKGSVSSKRTRIVTISQPMKPQRSFVLPRTGKNYWNDHDEDEHEPTSTSAL